jgi:PAS domain S-box-containing protein
VRSLKGIKWIILCLTALSITGIEAYYFFIRGVPLVDDVIDWLIGMAIAVVLIEIAFRYVGRLHENLQEEITERKQAEHALRKSEERFQQVAESTQEWIWEVDSRGLYTYASPVVAKIFGYRPDEIIGKKYFYDLFHPDTREQLENAAFGVFAKKESFREFISKNIHKNGDTVWLLRSGVPILDGEGNLLGYRGADR